jgi:hypothetical protein
MQTIGGTLAKFSAELKLLQNDVKDYGVKMEEEPLSLLCRFIKRNDDLQKKIYDARAELNGKDSSVDVLNV